MSSLGRSRKPRTAPDPPLVSGARWISVSDTAFALVDEADFTSLNHYRWFCNHRGYAWRNGLRTHNEAGKFLMHRVIMNAPIDLEVDHISGNTLDNRRSNLRLCTSQQNKCNTRRRADNRSGFKGVWFGRSNRAWMAGIQINEKFVYLGEHDTPEDAARAYDTAARKLHGDFAHLNFPAERR